MSQYCSSCKHTKPLSEFVDEMITCRICLIQAKEYRNTLIGRCAALLGGANAHSAIRANRGREEASICKLKKEDLINLYKVQDGKCYYSQLPLSIDTSKDWAISLERKDPKQGYLVQNIVFCAAEFNGQSQWSVEKVKSLLTLINKPVDYAILSDQVKFSLSKKPKIAHHNNRKPRLIENVGENRYLNCFKCGLMKIDSNFLNTPTNKLGKRTDCKECRTLSKKKSRESYNLRMFCGNLIQQAKRHSLIRLSVDKKRKLDDSIRSEMTLNIHDIYAKILEQQGKFFYSNVPLHFDNKSDWKCSLERLDNASGYTKSNTVLVALEFNTAKQWSQEKFNTAIASIQSIYNVGKHNFIVL